MRTLTKVFILLMFDGLGSGCGAEPPFTEVRLGQMPAQEEAFALLRQRLQAVFPQEILIEPEVRWWIAPCPGTDRSAVVLGAHCFSGIYYRTNGVDVAWRGTVGKSAYTHELIHYFLDHDLQSSDPDHLRMELWQLAEGIDSTLQDRGM